ncbi:hypothetical protein SAMN05428985_11025 [Nocardioides sp. YR527]|uniref:hypothetical protein n=1 Tax=Nocardioides sp. YR527 TaxID=1881028 RepID=UPI00088B36D7|nr:hypothetical protein [Nocardioides sp. YR527]SDL14214.1 hypothetical protein SAMN05428985_11025 [Nocardioides sp. YR527]
MWDSILPYAGGLGAVLAALVGGYVGFKKLLKELRGDTPEGQDPASLASVLAVATAARDEATSAKEAATRAETKVDAHLQSHADNDVRRPIVRLVREER